ncbi:MAG: helix-turn-helix domain-containing protein, partial [Kangiellaceae bacterium]|nr:helix-turn-helix domain-containing protein [Kangiellaceae bacterium]
VECYWQQTLENSEGGGAFNCLPPQGTFDLVFTSSEITFSYYDGKDYQHQKCAPGCYLLGQQTRSYYWSGVSKNRIFGIRLKPFALFPCTVAPVELKNSLVNINDVSRINSASIEQLLLALNLGLGIYNQPHIFFALIEKIIVELFGDTISQSFSTREMSNTIMMQRGNIRLAKLCEEYEISKVTLRQKFLSSIGLLPKELCKVWRVNHFLLLKQLYSKCSLTELGLLAGYYDQAHLNREFKSFFKLSPARYFEHTQPQKLRAFEQINRRLNGHYAPIQIDKIAMT